VNTHFLWYDWRNLGYGICYFAADFFICLQEAVPLVLEQLLEEWLLVRPCYLLFPLLALDIGGAGNPKSTSSMYPVSIQLQRENYLENKFESN
jgi:hypothetical protein